MKTTHTLHWKSIICTALLATASSSPAAVILQLNYTPLSGSAEVTAHVTLDDAVLGSEFMLFDYYSKPSFLIDLSITVAGAESGNGTYSLSDYDGFVFMTQGALPTNAKDIDLNNFSDINFLIVDTGDPEEFSASAPNGIGSNTLSLNDGNSVTISQISAIPEPTGTSLVLLGSLLIATRRKR
ncbi:MAG: hypothetical protein Q7Q71_10105 [Verrucomicrobiota bacterium JB023]|nr:hypothetical protein [Verrucomicrobiota bacterium JB023]